MSDQCRIDVVWLSNNLSGKCVECNRDPFHMMCHLVIHGTKLGSCVLSCCVRVNPKLLVPNSLCGHNIFVISVLFSRICTVSMKIGSLMIVLVLLITNSFRNNDKLVMRHVSSLLDIVIVVQLVIEGTCVASQMKVIPFVTFPICTFFGSHFPLLLGEFPLSLGASLVSHGRIDSLNLNVGCTVCVFNILCPVCKVVYPFMTFGYFV